MPPKRCGALVTPGQDEISRVMRSAIVSAATLR
jgi:hypothetical protein